MLLKDVHIVFYDISKAFEHVWHKGVLFKLRKAGVHVVLFEWFRKYLYGDQQVVILGQQSEVGIIKVGVPQGSVLGPLLFLIYINKAAGIPERYVLSGNMLPLR